MGIAQAGSGASDGGHVHRSSLGLALPQPSLLPSQHSHAVVRSSGRSAVSSSSPASPTHVFAYDQTRIQPSLSACVAAAASVPSISGCFQELPQALSPACLSALLRATLSPVIPRLQGSAHLSTAVHPPQTRPPSPRYLPSSARLMRMRIL
eukprot:COSAG01_NODE_11279_length_1966_cov_18.378147_1_plen_151_part_00